MSETEHALSKHTKQWAKMLFLAWDGANTYSLLNKIVCSTDVWKQPSKDIVYSLCDYYKSTILFMF